MDSRTHDPLWKALADPSRRHILDLLRERPRTTGELAEVFDFTRFATMKHLRVLEEAQLVTVRRKGRERWNHLNAVPLQSLYERWIQPFEAQWATRLLQLERVVNEPEGEAMPQSAIGTGGVELLQIEQEITLKAPRAKVFAALTGDISSWWGRPHIQDVERVQNVTIEPHLGGRFFERWSETEGALWATVTNFKQDERMILTGAMAMGGAVQGYIRFDLEDVAQGTRLKLTHRAMGEVNQELRDGYDAGWKDLLGTRLRAWVEDDKKLGLGHEPAA